MVAVINQFFEWLQGLLDGVLDKLPLSPFQFDSPTAESVRSVMGYVNYFFPVQYCLTILSAWLGCIALWYVAMIVLRWVKAIE